MAEATEMAMRMENSRNIFLLPPKAGDQSNRVSDNEKLAEDTNSAFEPAGTLEVEEDVLVDDISDASASTFDAAPSLMMICPTPNLFVKKEKQQKKTDTPK